MLAAKLLIIFIFSTIISGCSIFKDNLNDQITLTYWGTWDTAAAMNQILKDYKQLKPNVDIQYVKQSSDKYREKIESRIISGDGPDVFQFHNTWTPMLKDELHQIPTSVISQEEFRDKYFPTIFNDLRNSQKQFVGAPMGIDGLGLYWNEEIFQAAGVLAPPKTWPELAQIATKLTVRDQAGNIRTAGLAIGTASNVDHFSDLLALMILQNGGDLRKPTDQQSADALEYYVNFTRGDNRVWDETLPQSTLAFQSGSLAMYFGPVWRAGEIKTANPNLKFRISPVPQLENGNLAWASYWAVGVSAKIENKNKKAAAFDFLKYLQKDETLIKLYSESVKTPGRITGMPYPKKNLAKELATDPFAGAYVTDAPVMRSFPMASNTADNGLNDQIITAYQTSVNDVLKRAAATKALEKTAQEVPKILQKFGAQ